MISLIEWINLISTLVLTVTLITVVFQTTLLRRQLKDEHEWRRRERGLLYSQIYHPLLKDVKEKINREFGYIQSRDDPLTLEALTQVFAEKPSVQEDVNFLLAYLENIGIAVRHNIASHQIVYDLMCNTYLKYYYLFSPYIQNVQKHNPRLWYHISYLAHELEMEREKRHEQPVRLPRTGQ